MPIIRLNLGQGRRSFFFAQKFQFRYLLDGCRWENDWKADKYIPAPFSNADNSVVVTSK